MKRPASPSDADDPRSRTRRSMGRGRSWVPDGTRNGDPRTAAPPPDEPLRPPSWSRSGQPSEHRSWQDQDATRWLPRNWPPASDRYLSSGGTQVPHTTHPPPWAKHPPPWAKDLSPAEDSTAEDLTGVRPQPGAPRYPRKLTVTRVAAWRSRKLVGDGVRMFHRATTANGAGRSGLSSLTYATMMNYAAEAAIAVALANTLFFAAATAESRVNVALYLLITVAPFAVIAPVIGPLLDRLQQGRRVAMALSFVGRALLLVVMTMHIDDWLLYPAALGFMVLSKSFGVLKAAVTPRVLPPEITLVKTNSRLTVFGLIAGGVVGAIAVGVATLGGSPGALWLTVAVCLVGAGLCLRIPSWVEVTEGEVPASLRVDTRSDDTRAVGTRGVDATANFRTVQQRQPMGRQVVVALWGTATARVLTGFLTLFVAFVVKAQTEGSPSEQLLRLGAVGAAAGVGAFLGNAIGSQQHFGKPDLAILGCVTTGVAMAVLTAMVGGIVVVVVTALAAATCSAIAKVCLDSVIQRDLPEASRASAFGRSETVLQLAWVVGGAMGVLLPPTYWIGFTSVSVLLSLGLAQTMLARRGSTLVPGFGGNRPLRPNPA